MSIDPVTGSDLSNTPKGWALSRSDAAVMPDAGRQYPSVIQLEHDLAAYLDPPATRKLVFAG